MAQSNESRIKHGVATERMDAVTTIKFAVGVGALLTLVVWMLLQVNQAAGALYGVILAIGYVILLAVLVMHLISLATKAWARRGGGK